MKVLVACEFSGIVRNAFVQAGHDAMSCDLLPEEQPRPDGKEGHFQGDVRELLQTRKFDLMIAHPPCTRLCNSGVRWLEERNLWRELEEGVEFFNFLLAAPIERICIENPRMHHWAGDKIKKKATQIIQPWQFGHGETKETQLWLKNLPMLRVTNVVSGRTQRVHRASPSNDRWMDRSRTYKGIASAMAEQWGRL